MSATNFMEAQTIIDERQKTHGEFSDNAAMSQMLKAVFNNYGRDKRSAVQNEALDLIAVKLSRILSNPIVSDHWDDIAGYATLAANEIRSNQTK